MNKKILITGSSGFIGTNLSERFLESNINFQGIDLLPNKWNKRVNQLTTICDLRDAKALSKIEDEFHTIIHLAAHSRVIDLIEEPGLAFENMEMLHNILEYSRNNKSCKFIFASSREVYGDYNKPLLLEKDQDIDFCESPYAASKIGGEAFVRAYGNCFGLDYTIVRFSNVYGKYDESNRVIPIFLNKASENKTLSIFGSDKVLDFLHVNDATEALDSCVKNFEIVNNNVFNVTYGSGTSIEELAKLIIKYSNSKSDIQIFDNRIGEVMHFVGDNEKIANGICFSPSVNLTEGLKLTMDWHNLLHKND